MTFTSEDVQDLEVRVINIVGDVIYTENLQQFVGEYTKSIDLATYTKGVYFLALGSASCPIMGCTDPIAANYDSTATYDDGSCTYPCLTNEITWNMYDSFGDGWNGATYTLADAYTGAVVATVV